MRVLHLASADRWTGAAAPAFVEAMALRAAGVETYYGFVRGYTLHERLLALDWAMPLMVRRQDPISFVRVAWSVRKLVRERGVDIIHAHLTHDHALALWAARGSGSSVRVVRTFHATRAIRSDLISRRTLDRTSAICAINASFLRNPVIASRDPVFTPPPVDHSIFMPGEDDARAERGIPAGAPVIGFIGKMVPGRGFEQALTTFAMLCHTIPDARLLVVAKWGPHRDSLDRLAQDLGITDRIHWAGYQDEGLVPHFRAMNLLLFTAAGSDEGHRAIVEAMACGTPAASFPLPGIRAIAGPLAGRIVSADAVPESLAETSAALLASDPPAIASLCIERSREFGLEPTARRLLEVYQGPPTR